LKAYEEGAEHTYAVIYIYLKAGIHSMSRGPIDKYIPARMDDRSGTTLI